jgi:hypothetical protein
LYTDKPPKQLQHLQSVKVVPAEQEEVRNGSDAHTTLGKTNTELIKRFLEPFFTGKPDSFSFGAMRSWDPEKKPDKHELLRIAGEIASHFPPQQVRHQYCAKSLVLSWPDGVNLAHADNKLPDELKVKTESNESSIFEVFPDKEYKWCDLIDHLQHEGIDLAWAEELTAVICEARHRAGRPGSHCIQQTFLYKGETYRPVLYRIDRSSTATEYHITGIAEETARVLARAVTGADPAQRAAIATCIRAQLGDRRELRLARLLADRLVGLVTAPARPASPRPPPTPPV